jgi:nicotinate-nucleotide adenylyltransferase
MPSMARRIGILGGTFDPIHCGHLDLGAAAEEALDLTGILVVPANIPPHRPQPAASSYHRFAMVALALGGRASWRLSDIELRENRRSYTSLTLERLHADGFDAHDLVFITGADAFAEIETWHGYPALLDLAHFAVVSRPGHPATRLGQQLPSLAARMTTPGAASLAGAKTMIFLLDGKTADVSSTAIRQRVRMGKSIAGLVPESVRQYIEQQGLYTNAPRPADAVAAPPNAAAGRLHGQD